jgi:adenylate cyclase
MHIEIERKFLVRNDSWKKAADDGIPYLQSYLAVARDRAIRVRLEGGKAFLNFKVALSEMRRNEYEYEIPFEDASQIIHAFGDRPAVEKIRYKVTHQNHIWEIDEFKGTNEGLVVAEIELTREDEPFEKPDWLGQEVTDDERYLNMNLFLKPFKTW